ncbi:MAG: PQQ-like beta-propeller repeat protein [Planctomycetales bacterium]|nr:PQQ-like beta-propeller repeat protein [Planctomycetales bacterium]
MSRQPCISVTGRLAGLALGVLYASAASSVAVADDWPQWMGPNRDGVYQEENVIEQIPDEGLPILWRTKIAAGYSGPAVSGGRVFVTDYVKTSGTVTNNSDSRDSLTGTERLLCLDVETGQELWKFEYPRTYKLSFGAGPRATPTVDNDRVYVLGAEGDLHCLRCADGEVVWKRQLSESTQSESPIWGHAAHPLVWGELVYCLAGGEGSVVVALNKMSGEVVWQALTAGEIGYCPPTIYNFSGHEELLIWHIDAVNALNPTSGELIWSFELKPQYGMAIAAPQRNGNRLFVSGIGKTAAMLEIGTDGKPNRTLWSGRTNHGVYCGNATALFSDDAIYGSDCETGQYIAVNPIDGTRFWESFQLTTGGERRASHGTAFTVKHADQYFLFTETGDFVIAKLSPEGFEEKGRMHVVDASNTCFGREVVWSHPAFAKQSMFVRNDDEIVRVDLSVH